VNPLLAVALELAGARGGFRVHYKPDLLSSTRQLRFGSTPGIFGGRIDFVVAWSPEVLPFLVAGQHAAWHDFEHEHCRTWIEGVGCRCDVEPL
jgi:hypothetical protein